MIFLPILIACRSCACMVNGEDEMKELMFVCLFVCLKKFSFFQFFFFFFLASLSLTTNGTRSNFKESGMRSALVEA